MPSRRSWARRFEGEVLRHHGQPASFAGADRSSNLRVHAFDRPLSPSEDRYLLEERLKNRLPIVEVLAGLGVPLGVLVAADFAWLRLGRSPLPEAAAGVAWLAAAVVTPIVFWRLFRRSLPESDSALRWASIVALTIVCSLAWFYMGYTLFVNIHLALGGSL